MTLRSSNNNYLDVSTHVSEKSSSYSLWREAGGAGVVGISPSDGSADGA